MLADSHCHIDLFNDLPAVVSRAAQNGVGLIVSCATDTASVRRHLLLAKEFAQVRVCIGLHPMDFLKMEKKDVSEGLLLIEKHAVHCAGIGEVGLDFKHAVKKEDRIAQENLFREQVRIGVKNNLAIAVHSRFAEERAMQLLAEEGAKKVLMHWFTNSVKSVKIAEKNGFFMSCGPLINSSAQALKVALSIPMELLVLETDAPVFFLGKQSEPFWVKSVLKTLALAKGVGQKFLEETTTKNAVFLFGANH